MHIATYFQRFAKTKVFFPRHSPRQYGYSRMTKEEPRVSIFMNSEEERL